MTFTLNEDMLRLNSPPLQGRGLMVARQLLALWGA